MLKVVTLIGAALVLAATPSRAEAPDAADSAKVQSCIKSAEDVTASAASAWSPILAPRTPRRNRPLVRWLAHPRIRGLGRHPQRDVPPPARQARRQAEGEAAVDAARLDRVAQTDLRL